VSPDVSARSEAAPRSTTRPEPRGGYHRRDTCRACGGADLRLFLALGNQPLANALLSSPEQFGEERFFPLDVFHCGRCGLVQLLDVVDPEILFGEYLYVTGTSETIAAHNRAYAEAVVRGQRLGADDLVIEIASNDGSLLSCFQPLGVRVLGIEPASNIADLARQRGIDTICRFFDEAAGAEIAGSRGRARAVIGNNVLAHVDDPVGFLAGCRDLLTADGVVYIEVPYAQDMLQGGEYDTIYHEHLSYFSVSALARIAEGAGLRIIGVDRFAVHGGSIRVRFAQTASHAPAVLDILTTEASSGVTTFESWARFGARAEQARADLRSLLESLRDGGASLAAYGAPAKGNTLLNYCGIGTDLVPWTVDRNPLKVGLFTPGMHLPVLPVETVETRRPDYLLILAWNFADEIMRQQQAHADRGGRFVIPVPEPRVA
jgi:hypothetical protein